MQFQMGVHACSVTKWCPTFCGLMDCSHPGSSVHGISQTRVLEWGAIPHKPSARKATELILYNSFFLGG